MGKPYFAVKLKDPQAFYYPDETIPCIIELRTEAVLKDPIIKVTFKGRSSSYTNTKCIHFESIFDVEQEIKCTDLEPRKTLEIAFNVEAKKGVEIPSSCTYEGIEGGKIEYMVEAILVVTRFMTRVEKGSSIISVPLISKINIADPTMRRPKETNAPWPKNEDRINQCNLHTLINGSGWMRGKTIPVEVTWRQPERYLSAKRLSLVLIKQETIANSKDKPPNMSLRLRDKPLVTVNKEFKMERENSGFMFMSNVFDIDIPSNITPTIYGSGKVVQIDYKLCITVFLPEMGPNNQDREVSANLSIVIGTVHEAAAFDISQEFQRLSNSSSYSNLNRTESGHSSDNFNYDNTFYGGAPHNNTSTSHVYQQQPPYVDNAAYPPEYTNYSSTQPSHYAPNQVLNTNYSSKASYQRHSPPSINTGYQSQTTQHNIHHRGLSSTQQPVNNTTSYPPNNTTSYPPNNITPYPPNNITSYPPNNITSYPPNNITSYPPNNITSYPPNNITSYPPNNITPYPPTNTTPYPPTNTTYYPPSNVYQHQNTGPAPIHTGGLNRQPSVYPPEQSYPPSQPTLPMDIESSSDEDTITRSNRNLASNYYPPIEPDSSEPAMIASPVGYTQETGYYNDSGIQDSVSDENTTLSSKDSRRRNYKTQQ